MVKRRSLAAIPFPYVAINMNETQCPQLVSLLLTRSEYVFRIRAFWWERGRLRGRLGQGCRMR